MDEPLKWYRDAMEQWNKVELIKRRMDNRNKEFTQEVAVLNDKLADATKKNLELENSIAVLNDKLANVTKKDLEL